MSNMLGEQLRLQGSSVAGRLLPYLEQSLGVRGLAFTSPCQPFPHGWEASTSAFEVRGGQLPPSFRRPLVLRCYASAAACLRARREYIVQRRLWECGFPVAEPLLLELDVRILGGPFMIMPRVDGHLLLSIVENNPHRLWDVPGQMAKTLSALHGLEVDTEPAISFRERQLDELRGFIVAHRLRGLEAGLDWLSTHLPVARARSSLLHLDFHPLNLISSNAGGLVVLDWDSADVGDRWADVATACMLIECAPTTAVQTGYPRWAIGLARGIMRRRFLRAYCRIQPGFNRADFACYRAWAALRRLCLHGRVLADGPAVIGSMPACINNLSREYLEGLCRYFERQSGVAASLPLPEPVGRATPARTKSLPVRLST